MADARNIEGGVALARLSARSWS